MYRRREYFQLTHFCWSFNLSADNNSNYDNQIHQIIETDQLNDKTTSQSNRAAQRKTAKMSLTNCRFYEEKFPEIDSFVMVNVKQVRPI